MAKTKTISAPHTPSPQEQVALKAGRERRRARSPSPRVKVQQNSRKSVLGPDYPDVAIGTALLMESIGTSSQDFYFPFVSQLANAAGKGSKVDEDGLNFMLSVVKGIDPKDQVEAMLAAQMAAVHMATMTFARRLNYIEISPAGQRRARLQQTCSDLHRPDRSAEAIPNRRSADSPGRARHSQ